MTTVGWLSGVAKPVAVGAGTAPRLGGRVSRDAAGDEVKGRDIRFCCACAASDRSAADCGARKGCARGCGVGRRPKGAPR